MLSILSLKYCKVKWQNQQGISSLVMIIINGVYFDGDVALNEQIDVIAAEVASKDIPTLSMLMFCQPCQMKLKNYLLLPSHR